MQKASVNIFGKVSTMTRRIVTNFEDTVEVTSPPEYLQQTAQRKSIYNKTVPLAPGTYRLNVVAKDVVGGNLNSYEVALDVPSMDGEKLTASNIVLADLIEHVPDQEHRHGPVRDRHLQGPAARGRHLQARREDGHLL